MKALANWSFYWKDVTGSSTLHLYDKTKEEAMKIAHEFGFSPWVWYKPSTWSNRYFMNANIH